jgi:hypothetical protein
MKFCKDCKYFSTVELVNFPPRPKISKCLHPTLKKYDLVTGDSIHPSCQDARYDPYSCGVLVFISTRS